ncbi:MAG: DUF4416 family protein [Spirochaetales bacterium]|nr:DUF4416 family protein [Spirochaetales bacterium]
MGNIDKYLKEKLVFSILISDLSLKDECMMLLKNKFGPVDFESDLLEFTFSNYYNKEMGTPIKKFFVSFKRLIEPDVLAEVKAATNCFEQRFCVQGSRKINIDPGLLCQSRFILASTKDSSHRIPLGLGIYAEITLMFEHGTFRPVEWTYPDYRSAGYIKILNEIRALYAAQLKA